MLRSFYFCECILLTRDLMLRSLLLLILLIISGLASAATYNLSAGSYPPCNTSWSVSGSTYTCTGDGRVTLAGGDVVTASANVTISANNGFALAGNTIGSSGARINLTSNYGTITATGTNSVFGNLNGGSGVITLANTTVNGTVTTTGNINLTGGSVSGLVTSSSNTITTNGTNLSGGATAQSGMSITGGTIAGNFVMTANNIATFSAVTMTSGSISGASTVTIQNGSVLGSGSNSITISSNSGAINVDNSTVYGNLTAPGYSTVNITNGGAVYGTCTPNSTPANACNNVSTLVDHYRISHSGTGITCAAEAITIRAYNSLGNLVNPPNGTTITLSTVPATGSWSGGNTVTFSGSTDTAIKYLRQTTAATLNINVTDGSKSENPSFDPSITFVSAILQFSRDAAFNPIDTQIAGVTNESFVLRAIRTDNNTGACVAQTTGTRSVNLAYECRNPTTCFAGQTLSINGTNIASNSNNNVSSYQPVTLTFNGSGVASIPFRYSDVGLIRLHGQLALGASGNNPAITLSGSSSEFVVKPHTLAISAVTNLADVANPATTSSGAGFVAAGEKFKVSVQSRNGAGAITPNFGREITPQINSVVLSATNLVYPSGSLLTSLGVSGSFNATIPTGTFVNADVFWKQVGSIVISPSLNNYLGAGAVANYVTSGTVGRFYPYEYRLTEVDTISTCSIDSISVPTKQFLYMGKIFNQELNDPQMLGLKFRITAVDADGVAVSNYDRDYTEDGSITTTDSYSTADAEFAAFTASTNLNSRLVDGAGLALTPGRWVKGVIDIDKPSAQFGRAATPDGPYSDVRIGVLIKDCLDKRLLKDANLMYDTTHMCSAPNNNGYELARFDARYGRLRLDDAFGPETANLPVNFATEYWAGSFFVPNQNDNCTKILRSDIAYPAGNILTPANLTVALNGGSTTGSYSSLSATEVSFISGSGQHYFTAPTGGGQGSFNVDVDLTNYPWLRFDWNQDGNYSDTSLPTARFGFGQYRGHDRVIYWRERFN